MNFTTAQRVINRNEEYDETLNLDQANELIASQIGEEVEGMVESILDKFNETIEWSFNKYYPDLHDIDGLINEKDFIEHVRKQVRSRIYFTGMDL